MITEEEFKKRCAEILRNNITFAGQVGDYVIHGALAELWKLHTEQKLNKHDVSGSVGLRYEMCKDQPAQIDCRNTKCKFYKGAGYCSNVSPAITLNEDKTFVCWSEQPN